MTQIQEGAIGAIIHMTLQDETGQAIDLTGATTLEFIVERNGTAKTTWTASTVSAIAGTMKYLTIANDLAPAGRVRIQPSIVRSGLTTKGSIDHFEIMPNL